MIDRLLERQARAARRDADRARDAGRWENAARGYRAWLVRHPDDFAIHVQLGHMLGNLDRLAEADRAYAVAAGLQADDADLLLCWGHLKRRQGDLDGAREHYRQSADIDGNAAAREAAEALEPDVVPETPPEPEREQPPAAGRIESVEHDVVHGWLSDGGEHDRARIEFVADGRAVGRAWTDPRVRRGEGFEFRTLLALDGPARVTARRVSDGRELEGSPFDAASPVASAEAGPRAWEARVEIIKQPVVGIGDELAILVTHSATGALKPHVPAYLGALAANGVATLLVVVADRPVDLPPDVLALAAGAIVRENAGYDFAAWAHALHLFPEAWGAGTLYLANDSVIPSASAEAMAALFARVRESTADAVALTASFEYHWHVQSYFLALKPVALSNFEAQRFFREVRIAAEKDEVIRDYELTLGGRIEDAGLAIETLFPSPEPFNPMLRDWRGLIAAGMPFVKVLLLRGAFPEVDVSGWRDTLLAAGFDIDLVDAVLAGGRELPGVRQDRLSAHPHRHSPHDGPPRVAFYGPWNYDNGLGSASRGLIAALRRTGARLSLHPIKKPFHVHRPLTPPVDVADFAGDADIAIVHLNPDSWHLLDDAQRAAIRRARWRIGYWVWEMAHIPDAWWGEFGSVDRIWAPSGYCASLFAAQDGPPVDVVPHVVPVSEACHDDRATTLRQCGVDPARRVILYVFDGSSYLVRKNPAALVRAFAASGLATSGWTLLLKTKHLLDRPEEGRAFADLVAGEDEVVLLDRGMSSAALADLVAAADIYASPHASEGFGLTIAEAMAAGKPVVATDFGGSTDYLDETTGYPVRAHPWTLDADFGHYTKGGTWGRIDEPALSAALMRAAADVEAGDAGRGERARQTVAERLSPDAVAARIVASFALLGTGRVSPHTVRPLPLNFVAGIPVERGSGNDRVRLAVLAADGSVPDGFAIDGDAEWIGLVPAGTIASPLLATRLIEAAAARRDVELFYADDVAVRSRRPAEQIRRKPEFDRTLLSAQDYIGAPLFVRGSTLAALGIDRQRGTAAVADLVLRAHAEGRSIARIPQVLLAYPAARIVPTAEDYRAMLRARPELVAFEIGDGRAAGSFTLRRRFAAGSEPDVTIIVPTRRSPLPGGGSYVERLLAGIAGTDWPAEKLHVLIGDDVVGAPDWEGADRPFRLTRIETPRAPCEPFNYAAKMNRLWRAATTEQIVFVNDDLHGMAPGWLKALQTFALDEDVGGVGARLMFEDGTLQHAGLAPHRTAVAHVWLAQRPERASYFDWAHVHREWSMVTGAVFATRRSVMALVDGFDERFDVEFNDTDLCLRLRAAGYRIVCTPDAEMIHTEKASRGEALPRGDTIARFLQRWSPWIADDPAWHPRLSRDHVDGPPLPDDDTWYIA